MAHVFTCRPKALLSKGHAPRNSGSQVRQLVVDRDSVSRVARGVITGLTAGALLLTPPATLAADSSTVELFTKSCAGCHAGGGNIVQRTATLKTEDLQSNNAASPEQIYSIIYSGKGKMPGYGQNCTPKGKCTFAARLTDDEIKGLTQYILDQAERGWQD